MVIFLKSLGVFIGIFQVMIILRIFFSISGFNGLFVDKIFNITEPALSSIRSIINKIGLNTGIFDFSALVLLLILRFLYNFIGKVLLNNAN